MNVEQKRSYVEVEGMNLTGTFPVKFELSGYALGKRRNEVKVGMVEPKRLKVWEIASDEAPFHGGEESAPKPLAIFTAGVVTCFMTQMRTFARHCGVEVHGLDAAARFEWVGKRNGQEPYTAHPGQFTIDIELDTIAPLSAQKKLVAVASKACFAEQILSVPIMHRLRNGDEWIVCEE